MCVCNKHIYLQQKKPIIINDWFALRVQINKQNTKEKKRIKVLEFNNGIIKRRETLENLYNVLSNKKKFIKLVCVYVWL